MAKRIPTRDELAPPTPDPKALAELRQLVDALPDDLDAWVYVNAKGNVVPTPPAMRFWERVGLSAFLGAQSCWPDRAEFMKWATSPCPSLAGPGGMLTEYVFYQPWLWPRRNADNGLGVPSTTNVEEP